MRLLSPVMLQLPFLDVLVIKTEPGSITAAFRCRRTVTCRILAALPPWDRI